MSVFFAAGATSQSIDLQVVDDAGLPVTGLEAATFPTIKWSRAGANADATLTLADLATTATAWASGGVVARGEGVYRLDLPNAMLSSAGAVTLRGEATNKRLIAPRVLVGVLDSIPAAVRDVSNASPATGSLGAAVNAAGAGGADVWTEDEKDEALAGIAKIGAIKLPPPPLPHAGVLTLHKGSSRPSSNPLRIQIVGATPTIPSGGEVRLAVSADSSHATPLMSVSGTVVTVGGTDYFSFQYGPADSAMLPECGTIFAQLQIVDSAGEGYSYRDIEGRAEPFLKA